MLAFVSHPFLLDILGMSFVYLLNFVCFFNSKSSICLRSDISVSFVFSW